jgi:carbonic anhydrase
MKKLVKGIVDFRQKVLPSYRETFAKLALGQSPDTLFIACSDSRVAPNVFASTDPGDMFVIRNVGNLIPPSHRNGHSSADESEGAAIEFAVKFLHISDIIVCGHSECGAMRALIEGRSKLELPNLRGWLRHGEPSLAKLPPNPQEGGLSRVNQLSQLNVLHQLENLRSYPVVRDSIDSGQLKLHGWWFKLDTADVHAYEENTKQFVLIDEPEAARILERLSCERAKGR